MDFSVRSASIIGREHIRLWRNNQDCVRVEKVLVRGNEYIFGVVTDGCSEGQHSEVGANLLANFICGEIPMILFNETPLEDLPKALFYRSLGYLRAIAAQTVTGEVAKVVDFIKDYLLCTVVGFVMDKQDTVIYHAGDGLIAINDQVIRINEDNKPAYLAYHLVDRSFLVQKEATVLADEFSVYAIQTKVVQRLIVASDGLEEATIPEMWKHERDIHLERALKRLSRLGSHFADDCSLVVVEKTRGEV